MSNTADHRWDLSEREDGYLPECDELFEQKFAEWLAKHLTFPSTVTREEDEGDAYFAPGASKAPFRLGHQMDVLALAEQAVDRGVLVRVKEKGKTGDVPLCDVEVTPKTAPNFWPVREYVVWFANR